MRWYDPTDVDVFLYEEELVRVEANSTVWRRRAKDAYEEQVGFLTRIAHLGRNDRQKHHPLKILTKEQIIVQSVKGDALFYPELEDSLPLLFDDALAQGWHEIITTRPSHVIYICEGEVGASKGESTNIIRFDIDYSTPTVHCHPRRPDEVISPLLVTYGEDCLAPTPDAYKGRHYERDDAVIDDSDEDLLSLYFPRRKP